MFALILLVLIWLLYKLSISNFDYFEKIGIPFERPKPLFGNMLDLFLQRKLMIDIGGSGYRKFKDSKIFGFYNFKRPTYFITDIDLLKTVTIKDFDHFMNHEIFTNVDKVFNRGIFALKDKKWRDMRITMNPMFSSAKMKMMYGLLTKQTNEFIKFYENKAEEDDLIVDTKDVFERFAADGISTTILGFEADCVINKDSVVYRLIHKIYSDFIGPFGKFKFIFSYALPKIYKFLGIQCMSKEVYNFFYNAVVNVMNERERRNFTRPDMIQLLLQARKDQKKANENEKELEEVENDESEMKTQFTDLDWAAQGFVLFSAGFDTTSNLPQLFCYELALNEKYQRELQDEIDLVAAKLNGEDVSYETLHQMKFLDMVVNETMRKWPPAPQTDRNCSKDYTLKLDDGKTFTIFKGQSVFVPIFHIHRDARYFPDPEKFDPYRFSDENKDLIIPGSYLPFGIGPRYCIGSRFALMEIKLLFFNLFRKFSVEKCSKTPETLSFQPNINNRIQERIFLNFKLRK